MQIPHQKLLDFYHRARDEYNHPDPDRAVFGRAELSGFDPDFSDSGRSGVFGVSTKKAKALGYENLSSVEESFNAAMELDLSSYENGDVDGMFAKTAGISGGRDNSNRYLMSLDSASQDVMERIEFEDGRPIHFTEGDQLEGEAELIDGSSEEEYKSDTKRVSAEMQRNVLVDEFGVARSRDDINDALTLLRNYIDKAV